MLWKSRASRRFFFMFISFTLCLLAVIFPSYFMAYNLFAQNTIRLSDDALNSGMTSLESEIFNTYNSVLGLLDSDATFSKITATSQVMPSDYYDIYKASQAFQRTMIYRTSAQDCTLILPNGLIFTRNRIYISGDDMIPRFLQVGDYDTYDAFYNTLTTSSNQLSILPMQTITSYNDDPYNGLIFSFRLISNDREFSHRARRMLFYITLSDEYLLDHLMLSDMLKQSALRLYDADGLLLYESAGPANMRVYDTLKVQNSRLGLRVELDVNRALFDQQLAGFRNILYGTFAFFILGAVVLAIFYARRSARPVLNLSDRVARAYAPDTQDSPSVRDEYSYIAGYINHADRTMQHYAVAIEQQNAQLRSMLLRQIVNSTIVPESTIMRAHQYFPDFPARYVVALIRAHPIVRDERKLLDERSLHQLRILPMLEESLPPHTIVHLISFSGSLMAIIPQPDEPSAQALPAILSKCHAALEEITGTAAEIIVSLPFEHVESLPRAYEQTQFAGRLYREPDTPIIYCKQEMRTAAHSDGVVFENLERFHDALTHGNAAEAVALLQAALETLHATEGLSEQTIIFTFYAYVYQMIHVRSEMSFVGMDTIEMPAYDAHMNLESLFMTLENCALKMCTQLQTYREQSSSARKQARST